MMREWLVRLVLAGLGVACALAVGLLVLRPQPTPAPMSVSCVPAEGDWGSIIVSLVHDYRIPCNQFYWAPYPKDEFHNLISLNNYGLHDTDVTLEKPADTYRILIVGDSFPQGLQVPLAEGFPWLLEQQLSEITGRRVEVVNLSIDAYGTDRELMLYATLGWRFQADAVLLAVYLGNDIKDNSYILSNYELGHYGVSRAYFTLDEADALRLHNAPLLDMERFDAPAWRWLAALTTPQHPLPPVIEPDQPAITTPEPRTLEYPVDLGLYLPPDRWWADSWALTEKLIETFAALVGEQGSRFGVLIIPDRRAVHLGDWDTTVVYFPVVQPYNPLAPGDRLEAAVAKMGVPVLNLTYALGGWALSHPGERLYYPGDGHFNTAGHSVSAQRIRFWLDEIGWLRE